MGCYAVPGNPQSLGNLNWKSCRATALANGAQFFGMGSWEHYGWDGHYYCILLSQLFTDAGVKFTSAGGATCITLRNGGFDAKYSQTYGSWAVYVAENGTNPNALAPAESVIEIVHGNKCYMSLVSN